MDPIASGNREKGKMLIFLIPGWHFLPSFFLEPLQSLVEVSNDACILILFLMVDSIPLSNGLYERLCDCLKSDWVVEVETVEDIGCGGW